MITNFVLLALALFLVLNDRFYVHVETGGSGLLRVMDLAIPVIAAFVLILSRKSIMARFRSNRNLQYCLPYLLLGLLLPVLGVLSGDYPWRTLMNAIISIRALALIALGIWLSQQPPHVRALAARWMVFCIALEASIAICQFITLQHLFDGPFLQWLYQWDIHTMKDYKAAYLITGRSVGTFLGPNELGVWSVIAIWFSVTVLSGVPGLACTVASVLTLVLSQSRGSMSAFLVSVVLAALFLPRMKGRVWFGLAASVVVVAGLGIVIFVNGGALQNQALQNKGMQSRFTSGFEVLFQGVSADGNAAGRIDAWGDAIRFLREHPLGTWAEPQYLLQHFIDNQYVSVLLQGSLPFAAALLLALYAGLLATKNSAVRSFLVLSTVSIAVNGVSATPFQYSAIGLYWLALGYSSFATRERTAAMMARQPHTRVLAYRRGGRHVLLPES